MKISKLFGHVSASPTNPHKSNHSTRFDVTDLFSGPFSDSETEAQGSSVSLDEKLRQAYFWIVNHAVISPHYDVEYNDQPPQSFQLGDSNSTFELPTEQSYSSFILLPLLTFAAQRKCLFVGGAGRGKTSSALLMGILAGYSSLDMRRAMQHGHPQMTVADLLGNPLPADLVSAQSEEDIRIAWRKWLGMRVKIIDEYNRIPTRTQSALLTVIGDNYAEMLNQIYECPEASWFLTANDDQGGGTYQVIEALQDRIDIVVQALAFNSRFLSDLLVRIEQDVKPEEVVPQQIRFNENEIDQMTQQIKDIELPTGIRRRIEFFASHFEFSEFAAVQFEYKTKDTIRLSGVPAHQVKANDNGRDKLKDLGCQTQNGLSVRSLMSLIIYAKALAFFRGNHEVALEDVRQIMPFVLHSRLLADLESPFFELPENSIYQTDKIGWLRKLFDVACTDFDRLGLSVNDPLDELTADFEKGLDGLSAKEIKKRLQKIEKLITSMTKGRNLYGYIYDDLIKLKYFHQRYTNYFNWLSNTNRNE